MCAGAPAGAFSEPKIATLGLFAPTIASFSVFNTEMRLEGPFPADLGGMTRLCWEGGDAETSDLEPHGEDSRRGHNTAHTPVDP